MSHMLSQTHGRDRRGTRMGGRSPAPFDAGRSRTLGAEAITSLLGLQLI
jgi:hypothetical protein